MAKKLNDLGFKSSIDDSGVWMRPAMRSDGVKYYEYVLSYVDDVLAVSEDAKGILKSLEGATIKFKNYFIEPSKMYLGAKLQLKELNGTQCWTMTSVEYIHAVVKTIEEALKDKH